MFLLCNTYLYIYPDILYYIYFQLWELSGSLMSSCNDTEWDPDALGALRDPTNVEWTPDARKSMLQTSDAEEHLPWIQYPRCKATLLVNPY